MQNELNHAGAGRLQTDKKGRYWMTVRDAGLSKEHLQGIVHEHDWPWQGTEAALQRLASEGYVFYLLLDCPSIGLVRPLNADGAIPDVALAFAPPATVAYVMCRPEADPAALEMELEKAVGIITDRRWEVGRLFGAFARLMALPGMKK